MGRNVRLAEVPTSLMETEHRKGFGKSVEPLLDPAHRATHTCRQLPLGPVGMLAHQAAQGCSIGDPLCFHAVSSSCFWPEYMTRHAKMATFASFFPTPQLRRLLAGTDTMWGTLSSHDVVKSYSDPPLGRFLARAIVELLTLGAD